MQTIVGIDPGLTGAVAVLNRQRDASDSAPAAAVFDMPTEDKPRGKGRQVCVAGLSHILEHNIRLMGAAFAYIEFVQAMPPIRGKQRIAGTASSFSFGDSAGVLRGLCFGLGLDYEYVLPQRWKARAGLVGKPKDAARERAVELYPALEPDLRRKKDVGRADALLIAHFSDPILGENMKPTRRFGVPRLTTGDGGFLTSFDRSPCQLRSLAKQLEAAADFIESEESFSVYFDRVLSEA